LLGVAVNNQHDTYLLLKMQHARLEERLLWACNELEQLKKTVTDSRKYSEQRFDTLEQRFDTMEQRFDTLAERLDSNEKTLDDRIESAVTRALNKKFN
jgi:energy-converting hydrogenase A subunit M